MNQAGIDVLIQFGLSKHRQVYNILHDRYGDCALGILHLTMHDTREEAISCFFDECFLQTMARYEITMEEGERIVQLNDHNRLDFIGIARKLEDIQNNLHDESY